MRPASLLAIAGVLAVVPLNARADEVFLCGTGAQISPVIEIDRRSIGTGRPPAPSSRVVRSLSEAMSTAIELVSLVMVARMRLAWTP